MLHPNLKALLREPSVSFNAVDHTYQNKSTGEFYKGCTTVADAMEKPFLAPWHAKEMANAILAIPFDVIRTGTPEQFERFILDAKKAAPQKADKAKKDGTAAHDWIENYIASKMNPAFELAPGPESKEAESAVNAFVAWTKKHDLLWLASEEIVSSDELRTAGRVDAVANVDGILSLVDFKTSGQFSDSYILQMAGYAMMLAEMGLVVRQWVCLRIPKDGNAAEELRITNLDDMEFYQETFVHLLEAHKFLTYIGKFKGPDGKLSMPLRAHDGRNAA